VLVLFGEPGIVFKSKKLVAHQVLVKVNVTSKLSNSISRLSRLETELTDLVVDETSYQLQF
jgi:hypothetical protein